MEANVRHLLLGTSRGRRSLVAAAALLALAGIPVLLWSARTAPRAPSPRLVLLYAPCTVSKRFLSPYDPAVSYTPFLSAFAAGSVVFDRHQSESDQSGIAYAALFSGTQADRHGIYKHPTRLSDRVVLLSEIFSAAGYETFFWSVHPMASHELNYTQGVPGDHRHGSSASPDDGFLQAGDPAFQSLLDGLRDDPSLRAFVATNFSVTHGVYANRVVPFCRRFPHECPPLDRKEIRRFHAAFKDNYLGWAYDFEGTRSRLGFDEAETARFIAFVETLYKSNVALLDALFGAVIQEIERRGLLDESLIVFTTDHGEVMFRDNAPYRWTHGFALAREDLEIPLIVRSPQLPARRYAGVTRSIDVLPTLTGLSGVALRPGEVDGEDLSADLRGGSQRELSAFSHTALLSDGMIEALNPRFSSLRRPFPRQDPELMWVQVRRGDRVYKLANRDGRGFRAEVYDLHRDPDERVDLHDPDDPSQQELFRELAAYKQRLIEAYHRSGAADEGELPSEREAELLRSLGYIE
jgi:arylsulfatase A-like enzyme